LLAALAMSSLARFAPLLIRRLASLALVDDGRQIGIIVGVFHALAAKPTVPAVLTALLLGRKHTIDAPAVSDDTPGIVYI
jgi:hypothetical protein